MGERSNASEEKQDGTGEGLLESVACKAIEQFWPYQ